MLKTTTAIAAGLIALSTVAQAETVKENWNQPLGVDNPGRVTSLDECMLDNTSAFACWNDHELDESTALDPAGDNGDENGDVIVNGPTGEPSV